VTGWALVEALGIWCAEESSGLKYGGERESLASQPTFAKKKLDGSDAAVERCDAGCFDADTTAKVGILRVLTQRRCPPTPVVASFMDLDIVPEAVEPQTLPRRHIQRAGRSPVTT
jgi:hypothetical protein